MWMILALVIFKVLRLAAMQRVAAPDFSTKVTEAASRDKASRPRAPEPA